MKKTNDFCILLKSKRNQKDTFKSKLFDNDSNHCQQNFFIC